MEEHVTDRRLTRAVVDRFLAAVREGAASRGSADADGAVVLAHVVAGLRRRGRPVDDRTVVEAEAAVVPGARDAAVVEGAFLERTGAVTAAGADAPPRRLPRGEHPRRAGAEQAGRRPLDGFG